MNQELGTRDSGLGPRKLVLRALLIVISAIAVDVRAQTPSSPTKLPTELSNIRFNSGQSVVPYFEGWIRNPDGTTEVHSGRLFYLTDEAGGLNVGNGSVLLGSRADEPRTRGVTVWTVTV